MTVTRTVWNQIQSNDHRLMRQSAPLARAALASHPDDSGDRLGDGWLWYALGIVLLIYGGERRYHCGGRGCFGGIGGDLLFPSAQGKSRRRRPCDIEPHCWSRDFAARQIFLSLRPFDHGICDRDCGRACFIPSFNPACSQPPLLIAFSRIILGMHFLSDVVVGSIIGVILALLSYHVFLLV